MIKYEIELLLIYKEIYGKMIDEGLVTKAIQGIPSYDVIRQTVKDEQEKSSHGSHILTIFDDSREAFQSLDPLFTIGSHHMKCSAIVLAQMLYDESKHLRVISANSTYQVLLKTLRNQRQIHTLATQLSKTQADFIVQSYLASTKHPYSYLLIDFKGSQSDAIRLRSRIFK